MTKASGMVSLLVGLLIMGLSINTANAAPQALALVNSDGEVTLQCHDGDCAATFSTFCLEKWRAMPTTGTAYDFADAGQVRLVGVRADGSRVALDAANELSLSTLRRQLAVRITMPKERLDAQGLTAVSVEIGPNVTLLPKAVADDANPLSEGDIAMATGPLRLAGTRVVEDDPSRIGAARWIQQLSNALPPTGALAPAKRGQFLGRARSADSSTRLSAAERELAHSMLDVCQVKTELGAYDGLRQCFERQHDTLLWRLNIDYWLAIQHGS